MTHKYLIDFEPYRAKGYTRIDLATFTVDETMFTVFEEQNPKGVKELVLEGRKWGRGKPLFRIPYDVAQTAFAELKEKTEKEMKELKDWQESQRQAKYAKYKEVIENAIIQ